MTIAVRYWSNVTDGMGATTTFTFVANPFLTAGSSARNLAAELGPESWPRNGASFGFSRPSRASAALGSVASTATHGAGTASDMPWPGTAWRLKRSAADADPTSETSDDTEHQAEEDAAHALTVVPVHDRTLPVGVAHVAGVLACGRCLSVAPPCPPTSRARQAGRRKAG